MSTVEPDGTAGDRLRREEAEGVMRLAIGRLLRIASRPERPGDAEEFFRCRGAVLDAAVVLERSPAPEAEPFAVRKGHDRARLSLWCNDD